MDSTHALVRRTDPDTSADAAASIIPILNATAEEVYEVFKAAGGTGMTDFELEEFFPGRKDVAKHNSTLRTRRNELVSKGLIVDSGRRRMHLSVNKCSRIVWVCSELDPKKQYRRRIQFDLFRDVDPNTGRWTDDFYYINYPRYPAMGRRRRPRTPPNLPTMFN